MSIWTTLGLERTRERSDIRRAYARRLKVTSPEDDAAGFQALRDAYDRALRYADSGVEMVAFDFRDFMLEVEDDEPDEAPVFQDSAPQTSPPPPAIDRDARRDHERLIAHLDALVSSGQATPADLESALAAVLASPALEAVGVQAATEQRLAALAAAAIPRADPLMRPLIDHFRWNDSQVHRRRDDNVSLVLARRESLRFLAGIEGRDHPNHSAHRALSRPLPRLRIFAHVLQPTIDTQVRDYLQLVRASHPDLMDHFDAAALAWWNNRLARPHLSLIAIWMVLGAPAIGAAVAMIAGLVPGASLPGFLVAYPMGLPAALAVALIHLYLIQWPQRRWREQEAWRAPLWLAMGWAPAAPLLLLAAALTPTSAWSIAVIAQVAVFIAWWAAVTGEPDRRGGTYPWPLRAVLGQVYLLGWWVLAADHMPRDLYIQMSLAQGAGVVASLCGAGSLLQAWAMQLSRRARYGGLAALAVLMTAGGAVLSTCGETPGNAPLAAALISAVVIGQRMVVATLGAAALRVRHYMMWIGAIFVINGGVLGGDRFVTFGAVLLAASVVTVVAALMAEQQV